MMRRSSRRIHWIVAASMALQIAITSLPSTGALADTAVGRDAGAVAARAELTSHLTSTGQALRLRAGVPAVGTRPGGGPAHALALAVVSATAGITATAEPAATEAGPAAPPSPAPTDTATPVDTSSPAISATIQVTTTAAATAGVTETGVTIVSTTTTTAAATATLTATVGATTTATLTTTATATAIGTAMITATATVTGTAETTASGTAAPAASPDARGTAPARPADRDSQRGVWRVAPRLRAEPGADRCAGAVRGAWPRLDTVCDRRRRSAEPSHTLRARDAGGEQEGRLQRCAPAGMRGGWWGGAAAACARHGLQHAAGDGGTALDRHGQLPGGQRPTGMADGHPHLWAGDLPGHLCGH